MKIDLPSSSTPDGFIHLTITDYNLSGKNAHGKDKIILTKECPNCGEDLDLLWFLVHQVQRKFNGVWYSFLEEDYDQNWCRMCHPAATDFHIYRGVVNGKSLVLMRIWELRNAGGQPVRLFDPTSVKGDGGIKNGWERLRNRGIRLMDGTVNYLNLQPQSNRSISLKSKKASGKKP